MKHKFLMGILPLVSVLCAGLLLSVSCKKEETPEQTVTAKVSGKVVDDQNNPLEGVTVAFVTADSKKEQKASTTTGADGTFSVASVPSTGRVVNFSKTGYASTSTTIAESKFQSGSIELETVTLIFSQASIEGKVFNLAGEPYSGVKATCGNAVATTDAEGVYKFTDLTIKDYTIEFSDDEGNVASVTVEAADFEDGVAYAENVTLGSYVIPGLTYNEFISGPYWYGNDYAGGYGAFCACWNDQGFLTAYPIVAPRWRNAAEGISLYSMTDSEGELCSYMYGRKQITEGNCYVNICARNFRATEDNPAKLGIGVLDLTANTREVTYLPSQDVYQGLKKMKGGTAQLDCEFNVFTFDLSAYKGKEVAIAIGVFGGYQKAAETDDEPETPIVRIAFADKDMTAEFEAENLTAAMSGDKPEGYGGYVSFTKANISSLTPTTGTSFSGVGMGATNDGPNVGCDYSPWKGTNHIAVNWGCVIRNEAYCPLQDNIFALKGVYGQSYDSPSSYIAGRFESPKKTMTVKTRSYVTGQQTFFRVSVVNLADYTSSALIPTNGDLAALGVTVIDGGNGCLAVDHDYGSENEPDKFAALTFDLSAYAGKDVVIVLANHGGNPLPIYSVDFAD